ncbi:N-acyl homoserine lactonase family protein [Arthrobacter sp. MI7-26]|uniref:N-acyl homoserine lactonase family protein n=1 Tax=Arthrobacter sp. MI7-26 TaxID=2993653 RepID=UPI0022491AAE|nr:N-acyl homoserine lactonase family protein [Arthrobacter sp. MI7-26]MCX2750443.1 N-acyl homoserine lactonase family protein [Arthrobacter sp. MI7-26]
MSDIAATNPSYPDLKTDYSIWTLEFCHGEMPHDFFGGAGVYSNQGTIRVPMLYTLIVGGEVGGKQHVALVDCGFRNDYWLDRYPFGEWESPREVLGRVGYTPEDVDVILVSHMHFDHMGNFEAFPNAQLYVQFDEYIGWSMAVSNAKQMPEEDQSWVFSSFDPQDLARAAQGIADGRIRFVEGDAELLPGVTARLAKDSHTFGSQWFKVDTQNGPFVVAGDTVYWYSNVEKMWAPGYGQGNSFNLINLYRTLQHELKRETNRIIPGHDPEIFNRHTSWVTDSGHSVTEVNLRTNDASRRPANAPVLLT